MAVHLHPGCHADVGGGSHNHKTKESLSYIPLRWMIKECLVHTDIMFDHESLKHFGFDLLNLVQHLEKEGIDVKARGFDIKALKAIAEMATQQTYEEDSVKAQLHEPRPHGLMALLSNVVHRAKARADSLARIWDQLVEARSWWVLEFIPMLATYQEGDGTWIRRRM
jgi:hypothetical protein